MKADLDI